MKSILNRKLKLQIPYLGILFIVLLILKLTNIIHWSWVWICSPLYLAPVIIIFIGVIKGVFRGFKSFSKETTGRFSIIDVPRLLILLMVGIFCVVINKFRHEHY